MNVNQWTIAAPITANAPGNLTCDLAHNVCYCAEGYGCRAPWQNRTARRKHAAEQRRTRAPGRRRW